jgi:tetratricopeptide (TPR) repeat protein
MPGWLAELKRRRVLRVAVAYCVVIGGLLQLASVVVPALHLPDWTLTFLVVLCGFGFPVAVVLAWVFDLTPRGVVRTPPLEAPAPTQPPAAAPKQRNYRRSVVLAGIVLLVAIAGGAASWFLRRPSKPASTSRGVVAVLPFSVRGSDQFAYLSEGMVDLFAASLSQGGALRTVDAPSLLRVAGRQQAADLDPDTALPIARRFGAGLYVLGSVLEVEKRLQIHATLYDTQKPGAPIAQATASGEAAKLFGLVDDVLHQLRPGLLGARASGPGARMEEIAQATTSSLPALKDFLEGEQDMRKLVWADAQKAFEKAVAADPEFALAWYRLAVVATWTEDYSAWHAALRRARDLRDRLSPRDRSLLDALVAETYGSAQEAEQKYREILRQYPDDVESWYQLGEILFHGTALQGRMPSESRAPFQRAVDLDPLNSGSMVHLFRLAVLDGDKPEMVRVIDQLLAADPGSQDKWRWERAWAAGDQAALARQEEIIAAKDPGALLGLASAAFWYRDDFRETQRVLAKTDKFPLSPARQADRAVIRKIILLAQGRIAAAWREPGEEIMAPLGHAWGFSMPFVPATREQLARARQELLQFEVSASQGGISARRYLAGVLSARMLDGATAEAGAVELEKDPERPATGKLVAPWVRAAAAFYAGNMPRVVELLYREKEVAPDAPGPWVSTPERYVLGEALRSLGRGAEALPFFARVDHGDRIGVAYGTLMELRQAQVLDQLGETEKAVPLYQHVAEMWKDCDPELRPQLDEIRARLAALRPVSAKR